MHVSSNEWKGQGSGHVGGSSVFSIGSQDPGPLSGGHTDQRQLAAAAAASQTKALALPLGE